MMYFVNDLWLYLLFFRLKNAQNSYSLPFVLDYNRGHIEILKTAGRIVTMKTVPRENDWCL